MQYYVDLCECINTALFRAESTLLYFPLLGGKGAGDWASLLHPVERLCWNDNVADSFIQIHGYDIIRTDRSRHAGGVCTFVKTSIEHVVHTEITPNNIEALGVEI